MMVHLQRSLPLLDHKRLEGPLKVLQRFVQIVGKIRLATVPPQNHWWHVSLYVTARGLTTGAMPIGKGDYPDTFEIEFDLVNHRLKGADSWGHSFIFSFINLSVADFYLNLSHELERIGIKIPIHASPYKNEPQVPFELDNQHVYQQSEVLTNYFDSLRFADHQLKLFGSRYIGKESPSQFFCHGMDLSMSRFSGNQAVSPSGDQRSAVDFEAHSHEVMTFGYWAGDDRYPAPAFYFYIWPTPDNLTYHKLHPKEAFWHHLPSGPLGLLPYEFVRTDPSPKEIVQTFFQSSYEIGCEIAGWNREKLDSHERGPNNIDAHLSTGH